MIPSQLEILGEIYLAQYDRDLEMLYRKLVSLRRDRYEPYQKIVIVHEDTEYFFPNCLTGITTHNLMLLINYVDIPLSAIVFVTLHDQFAESIKSFITHDDDKPEVHVPLVTAQNYHNIKNILNDKIEPTKNIQHGLLCILGTPREHRMKLYQYLSFHSCLDKIVVNYCNQNADQLSRNQGQQVNIIDPDHSPIKDLGLIYTMPHRTNQTWCKAMKFQELRDIANIAIPSNIISEHIPNKGHKFYNNFAVDIVTETNFDYPHQYITEKIFRPILMTTPFVVFGPAGTLQYLKSYGFESFGDIWDESYDSIVDPQKRFLACAAVVKELSSWSLDQFNAMLEKIHSRLIQNRLTLVNNIDTQHKPLYNRYNIHYDPT
jgi:hypothetical protein